MFFYITKFGVACYAAINKLAGVIFINKDTKIFNEILQKDHHIKDYSWRSNRIYTRNKVVVIKIQAYYIEIHFKILIIK